jgi:hypothetical protein
MDEREVFGLKSIHIPEQFVLGMIVMKNRMREVGGVPLKCGWNR